MILTINSTSATDITFSIMQATCVRCSAQCIILSTRGRVADELSWALGRILELEERLEEANNNIRRLIDGDPVEWDDT